MIINGNSNPTWSEAIDYVIRQKIAELNIGIPGKVIRYDESTELAEIQIMIDQLYETGESKTINPLKNVPIHFPRSNSGDAYLKIPIKKGDTGWIKFSQRTIDTWLEKGQQSKMTNLNMFDLSDAVFEPGLYPKSNPTKEDNDAVVLRNEKARITLKDDKFTIGNDVGELLSLFNDLLSQLLISFGVSPVGPAPLDPASITELTRIQTVLAQIKGD